ncbi:hypothetical protein NKDENANG_01664 [Candidatus Entotheonellaceae bacterium PAL068K]
MAMVVTQAECGAARRDGPALPAGAQFVGVGSLADARRYTEAMLELTAGRSPHLLLPTLEGPGVPTGINVRRVVETGIAAWINTGIAQRQAGIGPDRRRWGPGASGLFCAGPGSICRHLGRLKTAWRAKDVRWLTRFFGRRPRQTLDAALWIYVRCRRCGEVIRVRADRRYDLVSEMLDPGEDGPAYTLHKDIVGERCFQRIAVDLALDHRQQVVGQQIAGGEFLTETDYLAATAHRGED